MNENDNIERIRFLFFEPLFNVLTKIKDANTEYRINSAFNNYFSNSNIDITIDVQNQLILDG